MAYNHLAAHDQCQISALLDRGCLQKDIAKFLGKGPPAVSGERRRNRTQRGYGFKPAHELAATRCNASNTDNARHTIPEMLRAVKAMLVKYFSQKKASNRLYPEPGLRLSHETLYQHVYADKAAGDTLHKHLRWRKEKAKSLRKWPQPPRVHPQPCLY